MRKELEMVSEVSIEKDDNLQSILKEVIEVGKKVVERGLAVGSGGNLSFRAPGTDVFFITGTGTQLDQLDESQFLTSKSKW
jgi:L-fuculose-phosphate aldolase